MSVPAAGELIRQKYLVESWLGEGGMGVVVAARHLQLEQRVAIKFLRPELLERPDIVERFVREARAAARIEGEHVAKVLDVDTLDDGTPYMVMEYLHGDDLGRHVGVGETVILGDAVTWVTEACKAIAEAHARGIVHRDLKPANLFLARRHDGTRRIKVLDFGISKMTDPESMSGRAITRAAVTMGSPEYMAPEQMLSASDVDARADVWSLGVILYELTTGRVPYEGDTTTQVYARLLSGPPVPPRSLRPDMPEELAQLILECLAVQRDDRLGSVTELAARLAPFAALRHPVAIPAIRSGIGRADQLTLVAASGAPRPLRDLAAGGAEPLSTTGDPSFEARASRDGESGAFFASGPPEPLPVRRTWPLAAGGILLAAAVAVTLFVATRGGSGAAQASPPAPTTSASAAPVEAKRAPTAPGPAAEPATSASASASPTSGPRAAPRPGPLKPPARERPTAEAAAPAPPPPRVNPPPPPTGHVPTID